MTHKATPEQWEHVERRILAIDPGCSCLLELRDRIAALETQRETEKACIHDIYEKLDRLKVQHESNWSRIVKLEEPPQPEPTVWSAINALADRLAALESAANLQQQDEDAERAMAPAPAGGLAEQTAAANHFPDATKMVPATAGGLVELMRCAYESSSGTITNALGQEELPGPGVEEFTAMLDVIADYLEDRNDHTGARWLREEVERG